MKAQIVAPSEMWWGLLCVIFRIVLLRLGTDTVERGLINRYAIVNVAIDDTFRERVAGTRLVSTWVR